MYEHFVTDKLSSVKIPGSFALLALPLPPMSTVLQVL